uniref:Uncharacterized protein n=1 Tax=Romanomermis culicivorax TaxID=13658 RepID=A0A915I676_ROMCU
MKKRKKKVTGTYFVDKQAIVDPALLIVVLSYIVPIVSSSMWAVHCRRPFSGSRQTKIAYLGLKNKAFSEVLFKRHRSVRTWILGGLDSYGFLVVKGGWLTSNKNLKWAVWTINNVAGRAVWVEKGLN